MRRTLSEAVFADGPQLHRHGSDSYSKTGKQRGKGKGGAALWWESGLAWWLKALLAMAIVGVVLMDIFLFETVVDRMRHPRDKAAGPLAAGDGAAARGAPAPITAAALLRGAPDRSSSSSRDAAEAQERAAGGLVVLRELAESALAIIPRGGAGDDDALSRRVGDDTGGGATAAAAVAAVDAASDGPRQPGSQSGLPTLGLSTASGHRAKRQRRAGAAGGGDAVLQLLDGLLPSRRRQQMQREQREWQELRQRSGGGGATGARWQPPPELRSQPGAFRNSLPPELRLPHPTDPPALRPPTASAGTAAAATLDGRQPLLQGPSPFVGLRAYAEAQRGGQTKPVDWSNVVPADFDWRAYLDYNPDVRRFGVSTEEHAAGHYASYGRNEGRVYKRVPLLLRYTACGGLFNQHYSHVGALSLALALGADVVLPAAVKRDSFAHYFSQDPGKNQVSWTAVPFDTLWDGDGLQTWLKAQGVDVAEAPDMAPLPDLRLPGTAFQHYRISGVTSKQMVQLRDVYLAAHDFGDLMEDLVEGLAHQAQIVARAAKKGGTSARDFPPLVLDMPCSLFSITTRHLPLAAAVARALRFSPALEELADEVVVGIMRTGARAFNGLHLRIEKDAADWTDIMGGREAFWGLYLKAAADAGLDRSLPLYMASGILSYKGTDGELEDAERRLVPFASRVVFKEQFLPARTLAALHPDQLAVVDFLVLVRSRAFVGLSASTFSVFIREYRHLHGLAPRNTSRLVDCTPVGSEPLFARAAVLPPAPAAGEEPGGAAAAAVEADAAEAKRRARAAAAAAAVAGAAARVPLWAGPARGRGQQQWAAAAAAGLGGSSAGGSGSSGAI